MTIIPTPGYTSGYIPDYTLAKFKNPSQLVRGFLRETLKETLQVQERSLQETPVRWE